MNLFVETELVLHVHTKYRTSANSMLANPAITSHKRLHTHSHTFTQTQHNVRIIIIIILPVIGEGMLTPNRFAPKALSRYRAASIHTHTRGKREKLSLNHRLPTRSDRIFIGHPGRSFAIHSRCLCTIQRIALIWIALLSELSARMFVVCMSLYGKKFVKRKLLCCVYYLQSVILPHPRRSSEGFLCTTPFRMVWKS